MAGSEERRESWPTHLRVRAATRDTRSGTATPTPVSPASCAPAAAPASAGDQDRDGLDDAMELGGHVGDDERFAISVDTMKPPPEPCFPLVNDLTTQGFITAANGWTEQALFHYDPWGGQPFGGADVIASDLTDPAFATPPCQ